MVVVGAGITGLAAAHELITAEPNLEVVVLDAASRAGGKILTTEFAGRMVDEGADQFLVRQPEMAQLCREVGLEDRLVTPQALGASLLVDGELRRFPPGLMLGVPTDIDGLAASNLVSDAAIAHLRETPNRQPTPLDPNDDPSVAELVRRELGDEVLDRLIGPLLGGVHAGDTERLSVRCAAPQIAAAAAAPEGLLAGAQAQVAAAAGRAPAPVFNGLVGGTSAAVQALVAELGHRLFLQTPVHQVRIDAAVGEQASGTQAHPVVVEHQGGITRARGVVMAAPTGPAATALAETAPTASELLAAIGYTSVVLVTFAFAESSVGHQLDGTGFLVPQDQIKLLKACSWLSRKFSHLSDGGVIARASAGSRLAPGAIDLPDDELSQQLLDELTPVMKITEAPTEVRITRWHQGLPQFDPGHLDRVAAIRRSVADAGPITIAGAGLEGLGLPTCVRQGRAAAAELHSRLQEKPR